MSSNKSNKFYNEKSIRVQNAKVDENKAKLSADADLIKKESAPFILNSNTDILVNYTRDKGIGLFSTKKHSGVEILVSVLDRNEEYYENNFDRDGQYEQD